MDVKKIIEERLGVKVEETTIEKNCKIKKGLAIGDGNVRPIIYPENYEDLKEEDIDDFINHVKKVIEQGEEKMNELKKFEDFEYVKSKLRVCVGPYEKIDSYSNGSVVKERFVDICKYVRIVFEDYTTAVTQSLMELWNITKEELFEIADLNSDYEFRTMFDMFSMLGCQLPEEDIEGGEESGMGNGAYIITSADSSYGAGCLCCNDILDMVCDAIGSDKIAIIPSSIHEVIALPEHMADGIADIIRTVNDTVLDEKEILSYSLYIYSKGGEVEIAG